MSQKQLDEWMWKKIKTTLIHEFDRPESLFENKLKSLLGASLTRNDIQTLINTPFSMVQQLLAGVATEIAVTRELSQQMQVLQRLHLEQEAAYFAYAQTKKTTGASSLSDEDVVGDPYAIKLQSEMSDTEKLLASLKREQNVLQVSVKTRDDYIKSLPAAWKTEHVRQIKEELQPEINRALKEMKLTELTHKDTEILTKVAKAPEIMLTQPALIPKEATFDDVSNKADLNLNIALMRVIAAKEKNNVDPDLVVNLKPTDIVRLQQGKVGHIFEAFTQKNRKSDVELMTKQSLQIESFNKDIGLSQAKIQAISENVASTKQVGPGDTPMFLKQLEDLYHTIHKAVDKENKTPAQIEAQAALKFNIQLSSMIKSFSPDEQNTFWRNCEKHAAYAGNATEKQRELLYTAINLKEELMPKMDKPQNPSFRH